MMTGQNCINLSQDSRYLGSDSNCMLYRYKYAVLPRHQLARFLHMSLFKIHSLEDSFLSMSSWGGSTLLLCATTNNFEYTFPNEAEEIQYKLDCLRHPRTAPSEICLWLYSPLLDLRRFFSVSMFYTVGRTPWSGNQPVARPLPTHRTTHTE
jgi:hypothetical protein